MATLSEINTQLVTLVNNALEAASIEGVQVGTEWPPKDALQDAGKDITPIIAIIHKLTNYQTRNLRLKHSTTTTPVSIESVVSDFSITPGQVVHLTLSLSVGFSSVGAGQIASCVLSNADTTNAATYVSVGGDTLDTMATALAAAIHSTFPAITATASGAVITVTNGDTVGYNISSNVGSTTLVKESVKWACRSMQINAWSGDLVARAAIHECIEQLLGSLDDAEGFALVSTEWIDLAFHGAKPDDAETDKDVFCDIFLFTLENMVDIPIEQFAVVAPIMQLTETDTLS